jgi:serine/threonine protein kinase
MGRATFTHPRFRVIRLLGEGGMGRVYLARDLLGKGAEGGPLEVALKVYPSRSSDARLKKEFLALRELHHPGIARAYHFGAAAGGEPFFTMERVTGDAIDVHLARASKPASTARGNRVDPGAAAARLAAALRLFTEAAAAAAYLHRRRVLHLDIKPANILVVDPGGGLPPRPVLIDFGLARAAGDAGSIGHATLPFAPPEILAGHTPTAASDVYALGATFHRSLSGRNPYPGTRRRRRPRLPSPAARPLSPG